MASTLFTDRYTQLKEALTKAGIDSFLVDEAIELSKCLPTNEELLNKVLTAASLLELSGGGDADNILVNVTTDNGTDDLEFPEGIRGVLTARGAFDGATVAIGHKETTGGAVIPFKHPLTGADLAITADFSFEFVMPSGGIIDLTTTGGSGAVDIDFTAISIKN